MNSEHHPVQSSGTSTLPIKRTSPRGPNCRRQLASPIPRPTNPTTHLPAQTRCATSRESFGPGRSIPHHRPPSSTDGTARTLPAGHGGATSPGFTDERECSSTNRRHCQGNPDRHTSAPGEVGSTSCRTCALLSSEDERWRRHVHSVGRVEARHCFGERLPENCHTRTTPCDCTTRAWGSGGQRPAYRCFRAATGRSRTVQATPLCAAHTAKSLSDSLATENTWSGSEAGVIAVGMFIGPNGIWSARRAVERGVGLVARRD
jgi:hypothetical protein